MYFKPKNRFWLQQFANETVPKIAINNAIKIYFLNAVSILVVSNHNSFRVLFDKIASAHFISKIYLYFSIGNGRRTSKVPIVSAHFRCRRRVCH